MGARGRQAQQRVGAAATKSRSQLLLGTNTPLGVSIATAAAAAAVAAGFEIAVLQPLFVMWRWQLQRCTVAPEDAAWHVRVALRPDIATAVVFPAKARRDDQLVQENHMACDAMLNIAAILTVSMSSRCRQLISAIIIATVSTSGAAARRGCPQRARLMFRTVSEIRAHIGRWLHLDEHPSFR